MGQRVIITLEDDTDGSVAERTHEFSIDGHAYRIDLSGANSEQFLAAFEPWRKHAQVISTPRNKSSK